MRVKRRSQNVHNMAQHFTEIATYRLNLPRGHFSENITWGKGPKNTKNNHKMEKLDTMTAVRTTFLTSLWASHQEG